MNIFWKKHSKLNIITLTISIIAVIAYIVGVLHLLSKDSSLEEILSCTADYITVVSCIIVLIQLVAFVKDSRNKEARSRKESALGLAKEYANEILFTMSMINSTLSLYYNRDEVTELQSIVMSTELKDFTKDGCERIIKQNPKYKKHNDIFENKAYNIPIDILAIGFKNYMQIDIDNYGKDAQKNANIRFRLLISDTLNKLEYFSMSVNQNVAESEMIFASLHQTFIRFVHFTYPMICHSNTTEESFYTNIIELYRDWETKRKKMVKYTEKLNETLIKATEKCHRKVINKFRKAHPLE